MRGWCSPPRSSPATPPPALLLRQGFSAARRPGLYSRGGGSGGPTPSSCTPVARGPPPSPYPPPPSPASKQGLPARSGLLGGGSGGSTSPSPRGAGRCRPGPRDCWSGPGVVGACLPSSRASPSGSAACVGDRRCRCAPPVVAACGGGRWRCRWLLFCLTAGVVPTARASCPGLKQLDSRRLLSRLRDLLQEFGAKALLSFDWASDD